MYRLIILLIVSLFLISCSIPTLLKPTVQIGGFFGGFFEGPVIPPPKNIFDEEIKDPDLPNKPSTPECSDGIDNDHDGQTDYPLDMGCHSELDDENEENNLTSTMWAYYWMGITPLPNVEHMFHLYQPGSGGCSDIKGNKWSSCYSATDLQAATASMPKGHKVMRDIWLLDDEFHNHDGDKCIDPDTSGPTKYDCIWWDNAVEATKAHYEAFFKEYHDDLKGELDVLILDIEKTFSPSNLIGIVEDKYGGTPQEYFEAIQNDLRFQDTGLAAKLGFSDLSPIPRSYLSAEHKIWYGVNYQRNVDYINEAVYSVVKKYYPNIIVSSYGHFYFGYDDRHGFASPGGTSNLSNLSMRTKGGHVGNRQAPFVHQSTYMGVNYYDQYRYERTPFNEFRAQVNKVRNAYLSEKNIPLHIWAAYKAYTYLIPLLHSSDYYQEMIFHLALLNPDKFLFYNPYGDLGVTSPSNKAISPSNKNEDIFFSNLLKHTDFFVGYKDKQTLVQNMSWWGDDFVLSGMFAGGKKVWRFTPELEGDEVIGNTLINEKKGVVLQTFTKRIIFSEGFIFHGDDPNDPNDPYSNNGYWIIQKKSSPDPVIEEPQDICSIPGKCITTLPKGLIDSLSAHWKFDSDFDDASKSFTTTAGKSVYIDPSQGKGGAAVFLGPKGDMIRVEHDIKLNLTSNSDATFSFWLKPDSQEPQQCIIEKAYKMTDTEKAKKEDGGGGGLTELPNAKRRYYVIRYAEGKANFVGNAEIQGKDELELKTTSMINQITPKRSEWNFMTYVREGIVEEHGIKITAFTTYLNGMFVKTEKWAKIGTIEIIDPVTGKKKDKRVLKWDALAGDFSNEADMLIGACANTPGWRFNGVLDELMIFNSALTKKQIQDIYLMQESHFKKPRFRQFQSLAKELDFGY